jgi:anti-sigma factor RsiW
MNDDLLNILSNSNKDIDNQRLMDYLSGKLSEKERHEVEEMMAGDNFMNDAVEGLQEFDKKKDIDSYVQKLHDSLRKDLKKKRRRREKRRLKEYSFIYIAILVILAICILWYFLLRTHLPLR